MRIVRVILLCCRPISRYFNETILSSVACRVRVTCGLSMNRCELEWNGCGFFVRGLI